MSAYKFGYREWLQAGGGKDGSGSGAPMVCDTIEDAQEYLSRFPCDARGYQTSAKVVGHPLLSSSGKIAYAAGSGGYLPPGDNPITG